MKQMKIDDDLVSVQQFIIESNRNLDIATAIYEQYEASREMIVKGFLGRLQTSLKATLNGWLYEYDGPFFTTRYSIFFLPEGGLERIRHRFGGLQLG